MRTDKSMVRRARAWTLGIAASTGLSMTGCGDFLEVTNPGAIETPSLENVAYLQLMYDGVLGDFQPAFAWTALFTAGFTDELRVHHTFSENQEIDRREVSDGNGTYAAAVFNGLHRARFLADSVAARYRNLLGDSAARDPRYARILAVAGYSWTLLGENICETRINAQGNALQPDELFAGAIERFDAAIAAAAEARAAAANIATDSIRNRVIAGTDSTANLARVGAARAALNANDRTAAIAYAAAVTPVYVSRTTQGFRFNLHYKQGNVSAETRRHGNPFWEFNGGTEPSWFSLSGTGFENLNDPRVPHGPAQTVQGGSAHFVPRSPASFSTHDGTTVGTRFASTSKIRLASAIEARYILAEAQGNTPANVDFLNEQRAVGGMAPLTNPGTAEYLAALRVQRAREFFIDGHRLGDLRRYEAHYTVDLWPTGPMYGSTSVFFGTQKCWPTPISETF